MRMYRRRKKIADSFENVKRSISDAIFMSYSNDDAKLNGLQTYLFVIQHEKYFIKFE